MNTLPGAVRHSALDRLLLRAPPRPMLETAVRSIVSYALVLVIVIGDWLTPAGVVVGILLGVPILLSSGGTNPRAVIRVTAAALVGFVVAAMFGMGPISPEAVWLPNRVFAMVAIVASSAVALVLQRRRIHAERARTAAESARDLNRLLHSLMAHDLRAPLALARQALGAVQARVQLGEPVDLELLSAADGRLDRSLRAIQIVLESARAELTGSTAAPPQTARVDVASELAEEVASFEAEAHARGTTLLTHLPPAGLALRVDAPVLRQAVAILVDNAIRHAHPGTIEISAAASDGELRVGVRDGGPGLAHTRQRNAGGGEGLGLRLCELLTARAGGTLELACDGPTGTEFVLRLPTDHR